MLSKLHLDIASAFELITNVEQGHFSLIVLLWSGWEARHYVSEVSHSSGGRLPSAQQCQQCAQARDYGIWNTSTQPGQLLTTGGLQWKF